MVRHLARHRPASQGGFTILELVIVLMVTSILLVPMLKLAITTVGGSRTQQTDTALEEAADALIAYASDNDGCLPFAADGEKAACPTPTSRARPRPTRGLVRTASTRVICRGPIWD